MRMGLRLLTALGSTDRISSMRVGLRLLTALGIGLGAGATAAGCLAPWCPELELINHFRPFMFAGAALLLPVAWLAGGRPLIRAAAALAGLPLALTLLPLAYRAPAASGLGLAPTLRPAASRAPVASSADGSLKVVTLNLSVGNPDVGSAARFLDSEKADVVVLQEADRIHAALIERVRETYPHAYCPDRVCSLALLSRRPRLEAGKEDVPPRRPLLVWARFPLGEQAVRVIGVHMPYPFEAKRQAEHTEWLIAHLKRQTGPVIVAGDLNLTPFSWKLIRLLHETGLRTHLLAGFSWPAHRYAPVVLLDHVLATADFATVSAHVGPAVGSDHRPVVVELAPLR